MTETLPRAILQRCQTWQGKTALRYKTNGQYRDLSWNQLAEQILTFGRGLISLGLETGERVAILSANSPEWVFADLGTMTAGGVTVPVYHTEGPEAALHILRDSGSRFLFIRSQAAARELLPLLDRAPNLEKLILIEQHLDDPKVIAVDAFRHAGDANADRILQERLTAGNASDLATLIYTSGTTGPPKGVMLSHENMLKNIAACTQRFPIGENDQCLSFLPLSHVFERVNGYYLMLLQGATIAYAESVDTVPANLQEVGPTIAISVPRLFEKMYARVMERILSGPWVKKQLFFGALALTRKHLAETQAGRTPSGLLQAGDRLAKEKIFSKLTTALGGNLRFFVSGGAPLARDVAEFFHAVGLPIYEGYGLTETSSGIAVNNPVDFKLGTVGKAIPGTELKIAADGEVLIKGPGVTRGYWNRKDESESALQDGWFHSGDIGTLDADGFLTITDRKKDLIVTAGGKKVAPQILENGLKADKFIANAFVFGDRKPYLTALLVPNFENLESYAKLKKLPDLNHCDLICHSKILELVRRRVNQYQTDQASYQQIKRFTLLAEDFSSDMMTPTMKLKRKVVIERFSQVIEQMYLAQDHDRHDSGYCSTGAPTPPPAEGAG
jgi:long-chain acyl-CoA synthetase